MGSDHFWHLVEKYEVPDSHGSMQLQDERAPFSLAKLTLLVQTNFWKILWALNPFGWYP